jgi:hypothetical protein
MGVRHWIVLGFCIALLLAVGIAISRKEKPHTNLVCRPGAFGKSWMYTGDCGGKHCSKIGYGHFTGECYDR